MKAMCIGMLPVTILMICGNMCFAENLNITLKQGYGDASYSFTANPEKNYEYIYKNLSNKDSSHFHIITQKITGGIINSMDIKTLAPETEIKGTYGTGYIKFFFQCRKGAVAISLI